jgi:uncharacterized DUF497 family protein
MAKKQYPWYSYSGGEDFEWDPVKDLLNQQKHHVSFEDAQFAFADIKCIIAEDFAHKSSEIRYYCFGKVDGDVITVRFTYRNKKIRIFGAGYWRKGRKIYEEAHSLH